MEKTMGCAPGYRCHVCCRKFKKFIIFEGHFTFNRKCRERIGFYVQCYMCLKKFKNLAALKYHLRNHVHQRNDFSEPTLQLIEHSPFHSTAVAASSNQMNGNANVEEGLSKNNGHRCKICNLDCRSNRKSLEMHMSVHRFGKLKCKICNVRFTKSSLTTHIKKFHPQLDRRKHQCKICSLKFSMKHNLLRHLNVVHKDGKRECKICKIPFTKKSLTQHRRLIHPVVVTSHKPQPPAPRIEKVQSKLVNFIKSCQSEQTDMQKNLPHLPRGSLKNPNLPLKNNGSLHQCQICKAYFTHIVNMKRHMKVHTFGTLTCDICEVKFTHHAFMQHQKLFHPRLADECHPEPSEKMKKPMMRSRSQNKHRPQSSKRKYQKSGKKIQPSVHRCQICNSKFSFVSNLSKHMHMHTDGEFKCEICNIQFTFRCLVRHNKRVHPELLGQPSSQCKICNESFCSKTLLAKHSKCHQSNYECKICNIRYTQQTLWRHLRRAHGGVQRQPDYKDFVCNVCKQNFQTKQRLDIHNKVHIDGGFECEVCHIPFTKLALTWHKARFHPDLDSKRIRSKKHLHCNKNFECYLCDRQPFPTFNNLRSHLNKHKIYQLWIDPSSIRLSNWSHAKSQEILKHKPLVLVENLDTSRIDLKSISDCIQPTVDVSGPNKGGHFGISTEYRVDDVPFDQTRIDYYSEDASGEYRGFAQEVEQNDPVPVSIESRDPSPTHYLHADDDVSGENSEALPILEQPIDSMCFNDKNNITGGDVIDVIDITSDDSGDEEVEIIYDISQVFYCSFCNELCHSLNDLGFHNKSCLLSEM